MNNGIQSVESEIIFDQVPENGLSVGEPVVMNPARARQVTDQIRQGLEITWNLIVEVYAGQAWVALGHSSWQEYCTREFGNIQLAKALPRGDRDEMFSELRDAGLSLRAIAISTGASYGAVHRSLSDKAAPQLEESGSGDPSGSPDRNDDSATSDPLPPKIQGQDGKHYASARPKSQPSADEVLDGQGEINDVLDEPITDFGIEPVNTDELLAKNAKNRRSAVRKLISGSGTEQAPLLMVISLAGQVAITPDDAENLDQEETITLFEEGSRGVVVLAQLMKTLDAANLDDPQTRRAVRANLNSCQEFIDEVLTVLEGS